MNINPVLISFLFIGIASGIATGIIKKCGYHEFDCDDHKKCISFNSHCNGIEDCDDNTDEMACVHVHDNSAKLLDTDHNQLNNFVPAEDMVIDERDGRKASGIATFIIYSIVTVLVAVLFAMLAYLYKKVNYKKPVITDFDNPLYRTTTTLAQEEHDSDEM